MELKALTLENLKQVGKWRNQQKEMLRTSFLVTDEMQEQFYKDVVCNRQANARFWGVWCEKCFVGMVGLENIQWENRLAEISLIMNQEYQEVAKNALKLLLHEGFNNMGLENIFTEVYTCSKYIGFWMYLLAPSVKLPNRKFYNGKFYDSLYINFSKERYNENTIS